MKHLKFAPPLPELILSGTKNSTWRIDDDKDISVDDILSLCGIDGIEFAQAHVRWIKITHFGDLTPEDYDGHESFSSEEELYVTYLKYYNKVVTKDTVVKVIKFELL